MSRNAPKHSLILIASFLDLADLRMIRVRHWYSTFPGTRKVQHGGLLTYDCLRWYQQHCKKTFEETTHHVNTSYTLAYNVGPTLLEEAHDLVVFQLLTELICHFLCE
jgi:hypothetical protein